MSQDRGGSSQGPGEIYKDYTVYDQHYEKVGKVDDLFVDENDQPEYIGVKIGFLGTKSTLIPIELVRVNDRRKLVEVAADESTIKGAPTFDDDKDITPEYEHGVYGYFGLESPGYGQGRSSYGSYYASDAEAYRDEELRRSVDTEYGERAEAPERPMERSSLGRAGGDNLDIPLDDPGRAEPHGSPPSERTAEPSGDLAGTGQTRRTDEDQYTDAEVQGDTNVRVYKRTRTVRG
jgi:hypothetical protein